MTKLAKTEPTKPASATAAADESLELAQSKLRELEATHAELATRISAKQLDVATLTTPDALGAAEIELADLELKARALDNAIKVAKRKCETARLAADMDGALEAAKVATDAQLRLKVEADDYARKLGEFLEAQRRLIGTIELFDKAAPHALKSAAATGQTAPKLHGAGGLALARAVVLEAREALGILKQQPSLWFCGRVASFPDAVLEVQHDMHQPTLPELHERLTAAQKLSALIDDTYPGLVKEVWAAREEQRTAMIASSEEREKREAAERKAQRGRGRTSGISGGGVIV